MNDTSLSEALGHNHSSQIWKITLHRRGTSRHSAPPEDEWGICNWIVKRELFFVYFYECDSNEFVKKKHRPWWVGFPGSWRCGGRRSAKPNNKRTLPKRLMPTNGFSFILRGHSFSDSHGRELFPRPVGDTFFFLLHKQFVLRHCDPSERSWM